MILVYHRPSFFERCYTGYMDGAVLYTLLSVFAVSAVSLVGVLTLSFRESFVQKIVFVLVSLSAGALFANVFVHLIPEASEGIGNAGTASFYIFAGILLFFILEKFLRWRHHHGTGEEECEHCEPIHDSHQIRPIGPLVLISDGLHNIIDGVIIAASYLVSVEVGMAVTLAVILHEIPQEIGDFGLLLHAGMKRTRALVLNFCSALLSFVGAALVLILGSFIEALVPFLVALAAGNFLYIAGSDILPELHKTTRVRRSLIQLIAMIGGFALMVWIAKV
jgi:zinc and cadmium transporter